MRCPALSGRRRRRKTKSPGFVSPLPGIVDADARKSLNVCFGMIPSSILNPERRSQRGIKAVVSAGNVQKSTHTTRAVNPGRGNSGIGFLMDFETPNQDSRRKFLTFRDEIEAIIHSVDQIHVRESRWSEHDFGTLRSSLRSMTGLILRADIGFHINYPGLHPVIGSLADEELS